MDMTMNEYQDFVNKSSVNTSISVCALGIHHASGKLSNNLKNSMTGEGEFSEENMAEALGDTLWYISCAALHMGMSLDTIAQLNIAKLKKRYPERFK